MSAHSSFFHTWTMQTFNFLLKLNALFLNFEIHISHSIIWTKIHCTQTYMQIHVPNPNYSNFTTNIPYPFIYKYIKQSGDIIHPWSNYHSILNHSLHMPLIFTHHVQIIFTFSNQPSVPYLHPPPIIQVHFLYQGFSLSYLPYCIYTVFN